MSGFFHGACRYLANLATSTSIKLLWHTCINTSVTAFKYMKRFTAVMALLLIFFIDNVPANVCLLLQNDSVLKFINLVNCVLKIIDVYVNFRIGRLKS